MHAMHDGVAGKGGQMNDVSECGVSRAPLASARSVQSSGLEGVVVAATRLSHVDGERGELIIAGARVEDLTLGEGLAPEPGMYERIGARLLELGDGVAQPNLREKIALARVAAFARVPDLHTALSLQNPMDSLIAALAQGSLGGGVNDVLGALPVYVAAAARLRSGNAPLLPMRRSLKQKTFLRCSARRVVAGNVERWTCIGRRCAITA